MTVQQGTHTECKECVAIFCNLPQKYICLRGISLTLQFGPSFAEARLCATWACLSAWHAGVRLHSIPPNLPAQLGVKRRPFQEQCHREARVRDTQKCPWCCCTPSPCWPGRAQEEDSREGCSRSKCKQAAGGNPAGTEHCSAQGPAERPRRTEDVVQHRRRWSSRSGAMGGGADSRKRLVKNKPPPQRPVLCAPHRAILPWLAQWPDLFLLTLRIGVFSLKPPSSCFLKDVAHQGAHPLRWPSELLSSATQQGEPQR